MCSRYPRNHCGSWCPADGALLGAVAGRPQGAGGASGSPLGPRNRRTSDDSPAGRSTRSSSPADPDSPPPCGMVEELGEQGKTPSQQLSTPRIPAAPSKSSSLDSRPQPASVAVRSLLPVFNGFTPAAIRATQLGGRFMMLRREAKAVASMQHRMSESPDTSGAGSAAAARKRARADSGNSRQATRTRQPLQELSVSPGGTVPEAADPAAAAAAAAQAGPLRAGRGAVQLDAADPSAAAAAASALPGSWLRSALQPRR